MHEQQKITVHEGAPLINHWRDGFETAGRKGHSAVLNAASREEVARDRSLGRPRRRQPELPSVKTPTLPDDFASRVAASDNALCERGLPVDAGKLQSLGEKIFEQLLEAEHEARGPGHVHFGDLTRFENVQRAMNAFEAPTVPRRSTSEQLNGLGKERDAARAIRIFEDFGKFSSQDQEAVGRVFAVRDLFTRLYFGQLILERLSPDGRLRSRFLCGGKGTKVMQWRQVLRGPLMIVRLAQPLFTLFGWLAEEEEAEPPLALNFARKWFGLRVPSEAQIRLAQAVVNGYLLGYRQWPLWEFVARQIRSAPEHERLTVWCKELAAHCPRITAWHDELRRFFYRQIGYDAESHFEFDGQKHGAFLDGMTQEYRNQLSALLALGIESSEGTLVARFQDSVLVEVGKDKLEDKRTQVASLLQAAFPGAIFQLQFEEVI